MDEEGREPKALRGFAHSQRGNQAGREYKSSQARYAKPVRQ